ncbi:MAG: hypothetical protein GWP91_06025, partial [Rhodobacterales bacterium]|nr:hypothetical protein [Rhodobacterales bacterium]
MEIAQRLSSWRDGSASVRWCRQVIALAVPPRPDGDWSSLAELGKVVGASDPQQRAALDWCAGPKAIEVVDALDGLDEQDGVWANLEAAAGVLSAMRTGGYTAERLGDRQARDAMHKAFTLALVIERLFPGTPDQKLSRFLDLQTGRVLIGLFGLVEVVLPFIEESDEVGLLSRIAAVHAEAEMAVVVARLGPGAAEMIANVLPLLIEILEVSVISRSADADALLSSVVDLAPGVRGLANRAGDVAAAGIDLLPVYHLLGPRLVAEASLQYQLLGEPEVAAVAPPPPPPAAVAQPVGPTDAPDLPTPAPAAVAPAAVAPAAVAPAAVAPAAVAPAAVAPAAVAPAAVA